MQPDPTESRPPTTIGARLPDGTNSTLLADLEAYFGAQDAVIDTLWRLTPGSRASSSDAAAADDTTEETHA